MYNQYEEESSRVCAMCNAARGEGITADITDEAEANIALCESCRADPAIVSFVQWLAGEVWLWLPAEKIAELERGR